MKTKKFLMLVAAVLPMIFISCGDDDDEEIVVPYLNLSPSALHLKANGEGENTLVIETNMEWNAQVGESWLKLSQTTGTGNASLTVTADINRSQEGKRSASIVVTAGEIKKYIWVYQSYDVFDVTQDLVIAYAKNSNGKINITTERQWSISGVPEWLNLTALSGTGDAEIIATALSDNLEPQARSATLIVEAGGEKIEVAVTQLAGLSVSFSQEIVLSNGYWCQYSFGSAVSGYAGVLWNADYYPGEETVQQQLKSQEETFTTDMSYALFKNLPPQTECVLCVAPYVIRDGEKIWGKMVTKRFTTASRSASAGVSISAITAGSVWSLNINTSLSFYYMLAYQNANAVTVLTEASDIEFAVVMYQNRSDCLVNKTGLITLPRNSTDYALLLVAWGGPTYGNVTKSYKSTSPNAPSQSIDALPRIQKFHRFSTKDCKHLEEMLKSCCITGSPSMFYKN